jgi:hypothetical protein
MLSALVDILVENWERYCCLREDIPRNTHLLLYAVEHGLSSWLPSLPGLLSPGIALKAITLACQLGLEPAISFLAGQDVERNKDETMHLDDTLLHQMLDQMLDAAVPMKDDGFATGLLGDWKCGIQRSLEQNKISADALRNYLDRCDGSRVPPLLKACEAEESQWVEVLLDLGADPNKMGRWGDGELRTPVDALCHHWQGDDSNQCLETLLRSGANACLASEPNNWSPLHSLCSNANHLSSSHSSCCWRKGQSLRQRLVWSRATHYIDVLALR